MLEWVDHRHWAQGFKGRACSLPDLLTTTLPTTWRAQYSTDMQHHNHAQCSNWEGQAMTIVEHRELLIIQRWTISGLEAGRFRDRSTARQGFVLMLTSD